MRVWFGIICFASVALLAWAMIVMGLEPDVAYGYGGGGKIIVIAIFGICFWLFLAGGYCAMIGGGGLDWLSVGRSRQHVIAIVVAIGAAATMTLASGLYTEPVDQIPFVLQPTIHWAMFALPIIAIAGGLIPLNSAWRDAVPVTVARGPQITTGIFVAVIMLGLSVQLVVENAQDEANRAREQIADAQKRDQEFLEEVTAADPIRDFGTLLGRTGIHVNPAARKLALEKLQANPNFTNDLVAALRNSWRGEAMTYVAWNDVPDPGKVAPAARDAIEAVAAQARQEMRDAHYLWDDYFDSRSERILAAADRLAGHGVNFVPAVKAFRDALDEPRDQKIDPNCRRRLDIWLKRSAS